ncbi:MAG TPA: hypothetical protein VGK59_16415 [Ohtaekwangia sp.]|jgi:hypothetical protein
MNDAELLKKKIILELRPFFEMFEDKLPGTSQQQWEASLHELEVAIINAPEQFLSIRLQKIELQTILPEIFSVLKQKIAGHEITTPGSDRNS